MDCSKCGSACCQDEVLVLADELLLLLRKNPALEYKRFGPVGFILRCPFPNAEGCSVYEIRPTKCHVYPLAVTTDFQTNSVKLGIMTNCPLFTKFRHGQSAIKEIYSILSQDEIQSMYKSELLFSAKLLLANEIMSPRDLNCFINMSNEINKNILTDVARVGHVKLDQFYKDTHKIVLQLRDANYLTILQNSIKIIKEMELSYNE